jgi:hypothetical protein
MTPRAGTAADVPVGARDALPFRVLALAWVITGGLVAAVTGPLGLAHGSWSAAFQVLVGGVMQGALGIAPAHLAARPVRGAMLRAQLGSWNLGCLAVIGGTLLTAPLLVDAGGLLLVGAMALMIRAVGRGARGPAWARWLFRAALVVTAVSIPVGLVLAHLRAA